MRLHARLDSNWDHEALTLAQPLANKPSYVHGSPGTSKGVDTQFGTRRRRLSWEGRRSTISDLFGVKQTSRVCDLLAGCHDLQTEVSDCVGVSQLVPPGCHAVRHAPGDELRLIGGTMVRMTRLVDVVANLDAVAVCGDTHDRSPTIFARRPWSPESDALVLTDEAINGVASTAPDYAYLLEVDLAQEALEVWSAWRDNAHPSREEATRAVIYYAEHDAYEPVD